MLIVVAILGGIGWWLVSSRLQREQEAKAFVREVATRLAFEFDRKILDVRLGREAQVRYPPSFRDRIVDKLRTFGRPADGIGVRGDVMFTSYFFQPSGLLRAELTYPDKRAYIDLTISHPQMWWQIDTLSLIWEPLGSASPRAAPEQSLAPPAAPGR